MSRIFFIIILVLIFFHGSLFAQTTGTGEAEAEDTNIHRSLALSAGYRFVDLSGSARAEEYEYLHNSIVLEGEMPLIILPHRLYLDFIVNNGKDYAGDLSYAYKDIVFFRGVNTTLYHNLDNITLIDLDPSTTSPRIDVRDAGEEYGIKTSLSSFFLRLKAPDFPFHAYLEGSLIEKDGTQQQRFMSGAAYYSEQARASRSRDINWKTEDIVIGANSHLGPVEIDISHGEKRFRSGGDDMLYDSYSAAGSARKAGVYAHNLIPEQKGSTDTIRAHTSYTGRLTASATLSNIKRENSDSGAKADYMTGSGEVTWMPVDKLTFFFNYRYKDKDIDNPESVTITDVSDPSNKYTYSVIKPSISSVSNTFSGTARYRALKDLTLKAKFSYDDIRRKNAEEWDLPERTTTRTASAGADLKLKKNLKLKAGYTHKAINSPATNIEPDTSDEGEVSVSWMPVQKINTFLSYNIKDGKRDDLHFDTEAADKRHVNQNRILGSVTILPLKDLSLTARYFYLNNKIQQDIEYHNTAGIPNVDPYVPYKNIAHNYAIDAIYIPVERVKLNAGISHTKSTGAFHVQDINLTQPVATDSFSEMKTEDTVYSLSGEYMYRKGSSVGLEYKYSNLDDIIDNPYDDVEDGRAHIALLTFLKKW